MQILLSLIVALAAALLAPKFLAPYLPASLQATAPAPVVAEPEVKETALQRVMRTGVIKCGYYSSPEISKDQKTGELVGVAFEVMKVIGDTLGVKIEWTAEVQPTEVEAALNANKFDLLCVPSSLGKATQALTHTKPVYYTTVWAVARADDNRFDDNLSKINDESVTIAEQEGDTLLSGDKNGLGGLQSKIHTLPQAFWPTAQFDAVVAKQADVTFVKTGYALKYAAANPKKIKLVPGVVPMGVLGEFYAMKAGENELKNALDEAIDKLNNAKEIGGFLELHNMIADAFLGPLGLKEAGAKDVPSLLPAKISYDATWLKKETTGTSKQPTAEELKALGNAPVVEPITESATVPKPDDAALEKAPAADETTTPKADSAVPATETPVVKSEDEATKPAADNVATPKADAETKSDVEAAPADDTATPAVKSEAAPETDTKAETTKTEKPVAEPAVKKVVPKAVAKTAAPPAPTLGDVKDALQKARKAAAAKAAEAGNLPPGVTAPQPLTGAGANNSVISPSLPESTISPTSTQ